MSNNFSGDQHAARLGEVILAARRVEGRLHECCGSTEVAGIHALTELLGSRLPEDIKRQLHYIAAVRNSAAHEDDFMQTPEEFARFQQSCNYVLDTLNRLFPPQPGNSPDGNLPDSSLDVAVEKEAFAALANKFGRLGFIPLLGNIYLLYILLYAICLQGFMLLLAGLYACSVVLGIKGWQSAADRGLLYVAGGTLLFAYAATTFLSFYAPVKKLPVFIRVLPGVNVIYLLIRFLRDLKWGRFLTAAAGLSGLALAAVLAVKGMYNYAGWALLFNYASGVIAALIWRQNCEK